MAIAKMFSGRKKLFIGIAVAVIFLYIFFFSGGSGADAVEFHLENASGSVAQQVEVVFVTSDGESVYDTGTDRIEPGSSVVFTTEIRPPTSIRIQALLDGEPISIRENLYSEDLPRFFIKHLATTIDARTDITLSTSPATIEEQ